MKKLNLNDYLRIADKEGLAKKLAHKKQIPPKTLKDSGKLLYNYIEKAGQIMDANNHDLTKIFEEREIPRHSKKKGDDKESDSGAFNIAETFFRAASFMKANSEKDNDSLLDEPTKEECKDDNIVSTFMKN